MGERPTWKSALEAIISRNWSRGQVFSLTQVYQHRSELETIFPQNKHVDDKIRQTLQFLREDGLLDFVDNDGHYRRV